MSFKNCGKAKHSLFQLHPIPPCLAQQLIRGSCLSLLFDGAALAWTYLGPLLMDFTGVGIRKAARYL